MKIVKVRHIIILITLLSFSNLTAQVGTWKLEDLGKWFYSNTVWTFTADGKFQMVKNSTYYQGTWKKVKRKHIEIIFSSTLENVNGKFYKMEYVKENLLFKYKYGKRKDKFIKKKGNHSFDRFPLLNLSERLFNTRYKAKKIKHVVIVNNYESITFEELQNKIREQKKAEAEKRKASKQSITK